jgi:hypothetical protein
MQYAKKGSQRALGGPPLDAETKKVETHGIVLENASRARENKISGFEKMAEYARRPA